MSESVCIAHLKGVKLRKFNNICSIRICSIFDERETGTIAFPFGAISLRVSGYDRQQHFDERSHGQGAHRSAAFGGR
jgi:hypothetical protein